MSGRVPLWYERDRGGKPVVSAELLRRILDDYALTPMGTHGVPHWARVLETGLKLAERTGAQQRVVALFAVFHDARRVNESIDPEHGRRGAALAMQMRDGLDLTDDQLHLLTYACTYHTDGMTEADITVRACWDADRLDLWRVGIAPHPERLCTEAARDPELLDWSRRRAEGDHVPAIVTEQWML